MKISTMEKIVEAVNNQVKEHGGFILIQLDNLATILCERVEVSANGKLVCFYTEDDYIGSTLQNTITRVKYKCYK